MAITIKNEEQIELMRRAGQMLARVHAQLARELHEGMTTKDVDRLAEEMILSFGGYPNFKNYNGFPAAACVSVNDEVVHGIPSDDRYLKNGDIVSIDTGVLYKGYHSDAARTHAIGEISDEAAKLIRVTEEAFFEAIKNARPGKHIVDIGQVVQRLALSNGYSVVRNLTGHGIGTDLHEAPNIPNYRTLLKGPRLKKGMTLAVEPMINIGNYSVKLLENDWTYATTDGSLSSHYENTIAVTDGECEILTMLPEEIEARFAPGKEEADTHKPKGDIREAVDRIPEEFQTRELKEKEQETIVISDNLPVPEEMKQDSDEGEASKEIKRDTAQREVSEEEKRKPCEKRETQEKREKGQRAEEEGKAEEEAAAEVISELAKDRTTAEVISEKQPKAPYQTLSPEQKRARRETLFEDD